MRKVYVVCLGLCLALMFMGCQLAQGEETPDLVKENHLIGIYVQIFDYHPNEIVKLLPLYGEEKAVYFINSQMVYDGLSHVFAGVTTYGFIDIDNHTKINYTTINDQNSITFTQEASLWLLLGPSLQEKMIQIYPIYKGKSEPENHGDGVMLSIGSVMKNTYQTTYVENDIIHQIQIELNLKIINELKEVHIIEMDNTNTMIKKTVLDSPRNEIHLHEDTTYGILESYYMNQNQEMIIERQFFDRQTNPYFQLHFLNTYGIVTHESVLHLIFKS